jgi:hypothetical protein
MVQQPVWISNLFRLGWWQTDWFKNIVPIRAYILKYLLFFPSRCDKQVTHIVIENRKRVYGKGQASRL